MLSLLLLFWFFARLNLADSLKRILVFYYDLIFVNGAYKFITYNLAFVYVVYMVFDWLSQLTHAQCSRFCCADHAIHAGIENGSHRHAEFSGNKNVVNYNEFEMRLCIRIAPATRNIIHIFREPRIICFRMSHISSMSTKENDVGAMAQKQFGIPVYTYLYTETTSNKTRPLQRKGPNRIRLAAAQPNSLISGVSELERKTHINFNDNRDWRKNNKFLLAC